MIRIDRLRALSKHLKEGQLGHEQFNFACFNSDLRDDGHLRHPDDNTCGACGCAIGELPILYPEQWSFGQRGLPRLAGYKECGRGVAGSIFDSAAVFFGITLNQAEHLFNVYCQRPGRYGGQLLDEYATRQEVAANIDAFCDLVEAGKITSET